MPLSDLRKASLTGKVVLVRSDFNVPFDEKTSVIESDFRIRAALPTYAFLLQSGVSKIVVCSHLGRPEGKRDEKFSLRPVAKRFSEMIHVPIEFLSEAVGVSVQKAVRQSRARIVFLENIRFYGGEMTNDETFARSLAALADIYVNDGFSVSHRKQASVTAIAKFLPSFAGLLLSKEFDDIEKIRKNPPRPLIVIVGGAKVTDKADALLGFSDVAEKVLLGGALANTFHAASGVSIGVSRYEASAKALAREIMKVFGDKLELPVDAQIAHALSSNAIDGSSYRMGAVASCGKNDAIFDIGPKTIENYCKIVQKAASVFWAGPLGYFEMKPFHRGTKEIAECILRSSAFTMACGGDTLRALEREHLIERFDHVSTGGSASLDFLAGKELPGLEALKKES